MSSPLTIPANMLPFGKNVSTAAPARQLGQGRVDVRGAGGDLVDSVRRAGQQFLAPHDDRDVRAEGAEDVARRR